MGHFNMHCLYSVFACFENRGTFFVYTKTTLLLLDRNNIYIFLEECCVVDSVRSPGTV